MGGGLEGERDTERKIKQSMKRSKPKRPPPNPTAQRGKVNNLDQRKVLGSRFSGGGTLQKWHPPIGTYPQLCCGSDHPDQSGSKGHRGKKEKSNK